MPVFPISGDVITVRIPELPEQLALANEDEIPIWDASTNVTSKTSLATLRTFIETGTGGTYEPIYTGGTILYIVPASAEGQDYISIPGIAGKQFKLTRDGYPMKPVVEFLILDAGGAKMIGSTLVEGQRYEFDIFELYNGTIPAASGGGGSGGFIVGNKTINTNVAISVNDVNKAHQVRGGSNALEITLPDVDSCPENSFIIVETLINNTKQHKILTTGGQYIYIENESLTELIIGVGEKYWFYRTEDGWYVIIEKGNYSNIGVPFPAYKARLNQIACDGQLLAKAQYPRLWAFIQTLGSSLITEVLWQTVDVTIEGRTVPYPYRGCFADYDTDNFRMPDYRNVFVRGLLNDGGSDPGRAYNYPGGFQKHEILSHTHKGDMGEGSTGSSIPDNVTPSPLNVPTREYETKAYGGTETRVDNIGLRYFMNY